MKLGLVFVAALLVACASYNPTTYVTETANLPHMCGYGVSPYGTRGMGCPEGYACRNGGTCEKMPAGWLGPGADSWGPLP